MSEKLPGFDLPAVESTQVDAPVQCSRCGRVLKNPASRERGIGPTCARKIEADAQREFTEMMVERYKQQMPLPGTEGL